MKNLILMALVVTATGCRTLSTTEKKNNPVIGMNEADFKQVNRGAQLIYLSTDSMSTYKVYRTSAPDVVIYDLYYFSKSKLFKFEQKTEYPYRRTAKAEDQKGSKN